VGRDDKAADSMKIPAVELSDLPAILPISLLWWATRTKCSFMHMLVQVNYTCVLF
jgi:hypothetical protein